MKTVFSGPDVAHKWAAQSPDYPNGRNGGDTFKFHGERIYSFGRHFIIAMFTTLKSADGRTVVLESGNNWGSRTSRHCSYVSDALRGHDVLRLETSPDVHLCEHGGRSGAIRLDDRTVRPENLLAVAESWRDYAAKHWAQALGRRSADNAAYDIGQIRNAAAQVETLRELCAREYPATWRTRSHALDKLSEAPRTMRERFAAVVASLPVVPEGATATRTEGAGESWSYTREVASDTLADTLRKIRQDAKTAGRVKIARDMMKKARQQSAQFHRATRGTAHNADALARAALGAAVALGDAANAAKRAGLSLPADWPDAKRLRATAARLAKPAARARLRDHVAMLQRSAVSALTNYATGQRSRKRRKMHTPPAFFNGEQRRNMKREVRALPSMPSAWQRFENIALASAESQLDMLARDVAKLGAANADTARDMAAAAVALETVRALRSRVIAARAYVSASDHLQEARETFANLSAMCERAPSDIAAAVAGVASENGSDYGGTAYARVRAVQPGHLRTMYDKSRESARNALTLRLETTAPRLVADIRALPPVVDNPLFTRGVIAAATAAGEAGEAIGRAHTATAAANDARTQATDGHRRPRDIDGRLHYAKRMRDDAASAWDRVVRNMGGTYVPTEVCNMFDDAITAAGTAIETARDALAVYSAAYIAANAESWRAGGPLWDGANADAIALRVRGETVETSHGAEVSRLAAKSLRRVVLHVRASGVPAVFAYGEGPRIGAYALERVDVDGSVKVGCHTLAYSELQHVADVFGWDMQATADAAALEN